jgi:hypothetical protein
MHITDIYRFHPIAEEYTFFSAAYETFSTIGILEHIASLNKYLKIEITFSILSSDHNGIKLEINSKGNHRKYLNTLRVGH